MQNQFQAKHLRAAVIAACIMASLPSLWGQKGAGSPEAANGTKVDLARARAALAAAKLPTRAEASIRARMEAAPEAFLAALAPLLADREADPMLLYRADKAKALPDRYEAPDLVSLDGKGLSVSKAGLRLRREAASALQAMSKAARAEGVTLLVSSTYRSYDYQTGVFDRNVKEMGRAAAEMVSAMPGHSQHQLGTAVDFGSITDAFAQTKASRWLEANARRFGFSLSFPKGMTEVTGYNWESWHYRYVGKAAASLEAAYFEGVQQYLMLFLDAL
jgi:zinc D-Ala-D-Ala carboxypeptidase